MRLLVLTQYFPPETGAPQARLYELATRLIKLGHSVTVITAMPNYPTGQIFKEYRNRLRMDETIEGIRIIRTAIYPSKSQSSLPRLLSYMSFALSSVFLGTWKVGRHDVVLFESPPLFLVPSGLLISWLVGGRSIMNVADIWPDLIVRMKHPVDRLSLWAMEKLESFGYSHSDVVALTNPGAMKQVQRRFPQVSTTVVSNGADLSLFRPELRSDRVRKDLGVDEGDFLAVYCGLHGLWQGLEVILGAADRLRQHRHIKIVMIGDGPTKKDLMALARKKDLKNLTFVERKNREAIPAILSSCDASIIPLVTRLPGTMPSKVYEALASAVPLLVAKGCEGESLVEKFDVGNSFEPMDCDELASALLDLSDSGRLETIRDNCLRLAKRFSRDVIAARTEEILKALAEKRPLPPISW